MRTLPAITVLLFVCVALTGCNRRPDWVAVSGKVTFDGQPVTEGQVRFDPVDTMQGQMRSARIVNGAFALPASQGLPADAKFIVRIQGFKKTGRKYPNLDQSLARDEVAQYLPARYNADSKLEVTISPDAARNELSFELTSAAR